MEEEKSSLPFNEYRREEAQSKRKAAPRMPLPKSYAHRLIALNELRQSRKDAFKHDIIEARANGNSLTLPRNDDKSRYFSTRGFQDKPRASSADSRYSQLSRHTNTGGTNNSDMDARLARMRHNILFGVQADERVHRVVQNIRRWDETKQADPNPNPWLPTRSSSTMIHDCDESHAYEQGNRDMIGSQINEELSSATALLSRAWKRAPWPTITSSGLVAGAPGKRTNNRSLSQGCSPNRSRDIMSEDPLPRRQSYQQHQPRLHRDYSGIDTDFNDSHNDTPYHDQDLEEASSEEEEEEEEGEEGEETNTSGNMHAAHSRGGSGYLVLPLRVSYDWSKASSTTMGEPFHKHRQRVEETPGIVILPTRRRNQPSSSSGDSVGGGGVTSISSNSSSITYETLITALYHQCPTALLGSPGADAMARSFFQPRSSGSFAQSRHYSPSEPLFHTGSDAEFVPSSSSSSSSSHVMRWIPRIWVNHRERVSLLERSRSTSMAGGVNVTGGRGDGHGGVPSTRIHTSSISVLFKDKGTFLPVLDEHSEVLVTLELLNKRRDENNGNGGYDAYAYNTGVSAGATNTHPSAEAFDPIQYFAPLPQPSSSSGEMSGERDHTTTANSARQRRNSDTHHRSSPSSSSSSIGKTSATTFTGKNRRQQQRQKPQYHSSYHQSLRQHQPAYNHRHSYWGEKYFHHAEYYSTLGEQKSEPNMAVGKGNMGENEGRDRDKASNDVGENIEIDLDDDDGAAAFDTSNILDNDSFEVMLDTSFSLDHGDNNGDDEGREENTIKTKRLQLDVSQLLAGLN